MPRVPRAPGPGPAMAQRGGPAVLPDNPFQDPAALQSRPAAVLDGYNPFESDAVSAGACPDTGACPCTGSSSRGSGALPAAGAVSPLSSSPTATAAVPDSFGSAAAPGTGGRAAPPEGESHRAPQLRLLRFAGTGGGAAGPGGLGRRREPRVCVSPSAGLGRRRYGGAAEAAGGAEPESGGAGPAGAGAAERGPRRFPE